RDALVSNVWWNKETRDVSTRQQMRFFSDLQIGDKLLIPARSPRALMVYLDGTYERSLFVSLEYYGSAEEPYQVDLREYAVAPAPAIRYDYNSEFLPNPGLGGVTPDAIPPPIDPDSGHPKEPSHLAPPSKCYPVSIAHASASRVDGGGQTITLENL